MCRKLQRGLIHLQKPSQKSPSLQNPRNIESKSPCTQQWATIILFFLKVTFFFFFFFWIGNEKKIINKETNLSTLAMHYGGIDQEPKLQQSRKTRKMQQSHTPSKESMQERRLNLQQGPFTSLKTSSLQIHHIKQCSTSLHKSILQSCLNLPCQVSNNSITFMCHNSVNSKQTKHQRPQLKCNGAMKKKMIHRLPTPLTHITSVKNNNTPFVKVICCKDLT